LEPVSKLKDALKLTEFDKKYSFRLASNFFVLHVHRSRGPSERSPAKTVRKGVFRLQLHRVRLLHDAGFPSWPKWLSFSHFTTEMVQLDKPILYLISLIFNS